LTNARPRYAQAVKKVKKHTRYPTYCHLRVGGQQLMMSGGLLE
jgi:hypothetical protein